jgi:hypothetical protein
MIDPAENHEKTFETRVKKNLSNMNQALAILLCPQVNFKGLFSLLPAQNLTQKLLDNKDRSINNLAHELLAIVISSVIPAKAGIQNCLKFIDSEPRLACAE